jgi:hypothetical protein
LQLRGFTGPALPFSDPRPSRPARVGSRSSHASQASNNTQTPNLHPGKLLKHGARCISPPSQALRAQSPFRLLLISLDLLQSFVPQRPQICARDRNARSMAVADRLGLLAGRKEALRGWRTGRWLAWQGMEAGLRGEGRPLSSHLVANRAPLSSHLPQHMHKPPAMRRSSPAAKGAVSVGGGHHHPAVTKV